MDMADIIAAHNGYDTHWEDRFGVQVWYTVCDGCNWSQDLQDAPATDHAAHMAEELTKAGYGSIQESKAKVWDEAYWTGVDDADIASGYTTDDFGVPGGGPIRPARINPYLLKAA